MNFKIIETPVSMPDVLLYRDVNDNGESIVVILANGIVDDIENMFASEIIQFSNPESAKRFIDDYSLMSAAKWCEKENITYGD